MAQSQMYNVLSRSQYLVKVEAIENIEDCGDDFATADELEKEGFVYNYNCGQYINNTRIKKTIESLFRKGDKSVKVEDEELAEALKYSHPVSTYVPNTRRSGSRITKVDEKAKVDKATYKHWAVLINTMVYVINYDIPIKIVLSHCDSRKNTLVWFKRLVKWTDIEKVWKKKCPWYLESTPEDKVWMKKMYTNPSIVPEVAKSKG